MDALDDAAVAGVVDVELCHLDQCADQTSHVVDRVDRLELDGALTASIVVSIDAVRREYAIVSPSPIFEISKAITHDPGAVCMSSNTSKLYFCAQRIACEMYPSGTLGSIAPKPRYGSAALALKYQ